MSLVVASGLTVTLGSRIVLEGVDLSVAAGEMVTLLGPNGSGKTTLLRTLLGAIRPTAGCVVRPADLVVGYVPQRLAIDPNLPITVARFLDLPERTGSARKRAALARVGIDGLERRAMTELSGGQFQRALLARALLSEPQLLMLDEPTQGLDQIGKAVFYQLVDQVRRDTGCGVLMVSHDLHVVMSASDRVVCLNRSICCEGAPSQVASAPAYHALFGRDTQGALALYRHQHEQRHADPGRDIA
ncbi:MAG: metal ABC transporter ATP-binding protein [Pseudomonadota bacterium]